MSKAAISSMKSIKSNLVNDDVDDKVHNAIEEMEETNYRTPEEFLEHIKSKVNTSTAIYNCTSCSMFPTAVIEDEYVVIVLEIQESSLKEFYGGNYLLQMWRKKKKFFQCTHYLKPQSFFLNRQRFIYSLRGVGEEAEYLYLVSFYAELYQKVRHPLYHPNNRLGIHENSVYIEPKNVLVSNGTELCHAKLKKGGDKKLEREISDGGSIAESAATSHVFK
jgi:hypothetical protein